jgi:hypothetical protein
MTALTEAADTASRKSVRQIPLSQGKVALVSEEDYERVSEHIWSYTLQHGKEYGISNSVGLPRLTYLHRFILGLGPGDSEVDHINGNGLDCRRENMRLATRSQNMVNRDRPPNTTSQYRGVTWLIKNRKWMAQIKANGKRRYLGSFTDEEDAARAYDEAAREAFGDFARLNF